MLSENRKELSGCHSKFERPYLESPEIFRIKFTKTGNLRYISHLDLQRTFHRVLVRAGIPMWYTKGFNPHAKLVFALPLPIGCESMCELADLKTEREITEDEIKAQLNTQLTDEMYILDVYRPDTKFADIMYAEYRIIISSPNLKPDTAEIVSKLFSSPLYMMKRTKSEEKEVNISDFIKSFEAFFKDGALEIKTVLSAGSTANLNPEYLIAALKERTDIFGCDALNCSYNIMRTRFYDRDMLEFR